MMTDPYKVLGIPSTATDDEVKQAYRRLAKRYHPDANPGDQNAERRMQEINAAYDEIMNRRTNPNAGRSTGYDPFGGFGGAGYSGSRQSGQGADGNTYFQAARSYIQFGRYREALNVLSGIQERTAEWYHLSALANAGVGNRVLAQQHAQRSVQMQPDNLEYRELYERLQQPGQTYTSFGRGFSMPMFDVAGGRLCLGLCLAQSLCGLCWRPC
ncbi:MAG: J domain-containing protein [bacterium]|nr:J domain-containing protein [bacterium]